MLARVRISVVSGTSIFLTLSPALKRWAKFGRPSGAESTASAGAAAVAVNRCATQNQVQHRVLPQAWGHPSHAALEPARETAYYFTYYLTIVTSENYKRPIGGYCTAVL